MLTNTPGDMGFEQAPFKLTSEFVDVMGGKDSASFAYFRELIVQVRYDRSAVQECIHSQTEGTRKHPFTDSIYYLRTAKNNFNYGVDSEFRQVFVVFFA
jgi:high-affinity K+ transport system ATPase subunit B